MDMPLLKDGNFYASATPQPGMVPVYAFTIAARDGTVYYLLTNKERPPNFSDGKIQFYAFSAAQPATIPVYLHTIVFHGTQVYFYD
jgi:hypothetical protein